MIARNPSLESESIATERLIQRVIDRLSEQLTENVANRVVEKLASQQKQKYASMKQLCEMTGLGERTLARWKSAGKIPFESAGRRVLFPIDATMDAIARIQENATTS